MIQPNGVSSNPMAMKQNRWVTPGFMFLLKLAVALAVFWALFKFGLVRLGPITGLLQRPFLLVGLVILAGLTFPMGAFRWFLLMKFQGLPLSYTQVFQIHYTAALAGMFLPGALGEDAIRAGWSWVRMPDRKAVILLSVVMDRLIGAVAALTTGFAALLICLVRGGLPVALTGLFTALTWTLSALLTIGVGLGVWSRRRKHRLAQHDGPHQDAPARKAAQIVEAVGLYRERLGGVALCWLLSVSMFAKDIFILGVATEAMGMGPVGAGAYALAGTITFIVNFLPVTPGGLGVGEVAYAQVIHWIAPVAAPQPYGSAVLVFRALLTVCLLPSGLLLAAALKGDRCGAGRRLGPD